MKIAVDISNSVAMMEEGQLLTLLVRAVGMYDGVLQVVNDGEAINAPHAEKVLVPSNCQRSDGHVGEEADAVGGLEAGVTFNALRADLQGCLPVPPVLPGIVPHDGDTNNLFACSCIQV